MTVLHTKEEDWELISIMLVHYETNPPEMWTGYELVTWLDTVRYWDCTRQ